MEYVEWVFTLNIVYFSFATPQKLSQYSTDM